MVMITHEGQVKLLSHAILKSTCDIDVKYYPFDQQTCDMAFSPWTYDNVEVKKKIRVKTIVPNF